MFKLSTLAFLAQSSYRLSYRSVLICLLLSDYYYQIAIILDLIEILIQSGPPDNCCQDPKGYPGSSPVVDIHYLLFWEILLTNKQTNRQTKYFVRTEVRTLDLCVFSTMRLPTELKGRTHLITIIKILLSDYYYQINKKLLTHRGSNSRSSCF